MHHSNYSLVLKIANCTIRNNRRVDTRLTIRSPILYENSSRKILQGPLISRKVCIKDPQFHPFCLCYIYTFSSHLCKIHRQLHSSTVSCRSQFKPVQFSEHPEYIHITQGYKYKNKIYTIFANQPGRAKVISRPLRRHARSWNKCRNTSGLTFWTISLVHYIQLFY